MFDQPVAQYTVDIDELKNSISNESHSSVELSDVVIAMYPWTNIWPEAVVGYVKV